MENSKQVLDEIKKSLKEDKIFTAANYDQLVAPITEIYKETSTNVYLIVSNQLIKFRLEKFYQETFNNMWYKCSGEKKIVKFIVAKDIEAEQQKASEMQINRVNSSELNKTLRKLRSEYTFENFVTGESNRYAWITAMKVAESPNVTVNPLYIFGDVGLGKTHLMTAIGLYMLDKNPNINVVYTTSQQFVEDYYQATTKKSLNSMQEFNDYYRNADVLLVDDIQLLANKNSSQEEFFKLFEYLFENNKQIIITSDRRADELENIMMRLKSRFSWGIPVDISSPNFELRKAILQRKLAYLISNPEDVSHEALEYIAENFSENVRVLEGALRRYINYCVSFNIEFSLENAKTSLDSLVVSEPTNIEEEDSINVAKVKKVVANYYNITITDLASTTRKAEILFPRQVAIYLIRTLYNIPLQKIGDFFGGKDHTTISHGFDKIKKLIETDWTVKAVIDNFLPLLILVVAGTIFCVAMVVFVAPKLLKKDWFEKAIAEFGQATGVTATGLMLLRTVDPENKTEAAASFGYKQLIHEPIMGGGLWTAFALTLVFSIGWMPIWIFSCVMLVVWGIIALIIIKRR